MLLTAKLQLWRFIQTSNLLMRSQLDCWDPRLEGTGFFDVKTRATVAIRHDIDNYKVCPSCS